MRFSGKGFRSCGSRVIVECGRKLTMGPRSELDECLSEGTGRGLNWHPWAAAGAGDVRPIPIGDLYKHWSPQRGFRMPGARRQLPAVASRLQASNEFLVIQLAACVKRPIEAAVYVPVLQMCVVDGVSKFCGMRGNKENIGEFCGTKENVSNRGLGLSWGLVVVAANCGRGSAFSTTRRRPCPSNGAASAWVED